MCLRLQNSIKLVFERSWHAGLVATACQYSNDLASLKVSDVSNSNNSNILILTILSTLTTISNSNNSNIIYYSGSCFLSYFIQV